MSITTIDTMKQQKQQIIAGQETCGDTYGEMESLFLKAKRILTNYERALGVTTALLDRSAKIVKIKQREKQTQLCAFCRKLIQNPSQSLDEKKYPCGKVHLAALARSRHKGKGIVYFCMAGFAFWTSPIYRNKRYAGAITATEPMPFEKAAERFRLYCKDVSAAERLKKAPLEAAEKPNDKVLAMARILELCAQEISEKGGDLSKAIRRIARWGAETKSLNISLPENQIEKERELLAAFQRGDNSGGFKIITELIDGIYCGTPKNMEMRRIRAIELVVLLSRAAVNSGALLTNAIHKANNKNFQRIKESKTVEELRDNLRFAAEQMASEIFSFRGMRHASALRKAQSYIWKNLGQKVSLEEISKAAGLSAPYFSTVFKEEMGENFSSYINRIRVGKAAVLLKETSNPIKSIAKTCGFEDQSWFSKIFKLYTGTTPGKYRETGTHTGSHHA